MVKITELFALRDEAAVLANLKDHFCQPTCKECIGYVLQRLEYNRSHVNIN